MSKRVFDLVVATVLLLAAAPLLAVLAVAIVVTMGRPVLFAQVRPGRDGRPFVLYKLRTMRSPLSPDRVLYDDEERITRLGRFLRETSLDELPELWNVVRGDMSLVGPRPLLMEYLDLYTPEQARRHTIRPGLTGLSQVSGRNDLDWQDRLSLDVVYVDRRSMRLDLLILARTFLIVATRRGVTPADQGTVPLFEGNRGAGAAR